VRVAIGSNCQAVCVALIVATKKGYIRSSFLVVILKFAASLPAWFLYFPGILAVDSEHGQLTSTLETVMQEGAFSKDFLRGVVAGRKPKMG
jgi:hypothetical protein